MKRCAYLWKFAGLKILWLLPLLAAVAIAASASAQEIGLIGRVKDLLQTGAVPVPATERYLPRLNEQLLNIHGHFQQTELRALRNFTYVGQLRIDRADGGVGITFYTDYLDADRYYRLRCYAGNLLRSLRFPMTIINGFAKSLNDAGHVSFGTRADSTILMG